MLEMLCNQAGTICYHCIPAVQIKIFRGEIPWAQMAEESLRVGWSFAYSFPDSALQGNCHKRSAKSIRFLWHCTVMPASASSLPLFRHAKITSYMPSTGPQHESRSEHERPPPPSRQIRLLAATLGSIALSASRHLAPPLMHARSQRIATTRCLTVGQGRCSASLIQRFKAPDTLDCDRSRSACRFALGCFRKTVSCRAVTELPRCGEVPKLRVSRAFKIKHH